MEVRSCHCSAQTPHGLPISLSESSRPCNNAPSLRHLPPPSFLGFTSCFSPLLSPFSHLTFLLFSNMQTPTSGLFHLPGTLTLPARLSPMVVTLKSLKSLLKSHLLKEVFSLTPYLKLWPFHIFALCTLVFHCNIVFIYLFILLTVCFHPQYKLWESRDLSFSFTAVSST